MNVGVGHQDQQACWVAYGEEEGCGRDEVRRSCSWNVSVPVEELELGTVVKMRRVEMSAGKF